MLLILSSFNCMVFVHAVGDVDSLPFWHSFAAQLDWWSLKRKQALHLSLSQPPKAEVTNMSGWFYLNFTAGTRSLNWRRRYTNSRGGECSGCPFDNPLHQTMWPLKSSCIRICILTSKSLAMVGKIGGAPTPMKYHPCGKWKPLYILICILSSKCLAMVG